MKRRHSSHLVDFFPEERIVVTAGVVLALVTLFTFFAPTLMRTALAPFLSFAPQAIVSGGNSSSFAWAFAIGLVIVGVLLLYNYLRHKNQLEAEE